MITQKDKNGIHSRFLNRYASALTVPFCILLTLLAVVLPVIIWQLKVPIIARTYDSSIPGRPDSQPFELFGLLISVLLLFVTWLNVKRQKKKTLTSLTPVLLPLLVSLQVLFVVIEQAQPQSGDYLCYQNAAQAVVSGLNPYTVYLKCYLYPPIQAQVLAVLYHVVNWGLLFSPGDTDKAWTIVFYLYQCGQFLQILLAYYLTYQIAQRMGLRALPASIIVSALFLFNNPLVRTINFNQINVWILNSFLLAILFVPRRPFLSGLAVAVGAHIKLYTFSLLLPWMLQKQWRAILGVITGFSVILLTQTGFGQNWTLWQQFLQYFFQRVEKPSNYRNSGIWSFIYNLVKIPGRFVDASLFDFVPAVVAVINLLIIAWFVIRILKREKAYSEMVKSDVSNESSDGKNSWYEIYRHYGHSIDAIALGLLISPSVWEHHYVLVIPLALWAIVTRRHDRPWLAGIGVFLIFGLPTFDVFPLAHHRLLGLFILVVLTSPIPIQKYFLTRNRRSLTTA